MPRTPTDERLHALAQMRTLSRRFAAGQVPFDDFYPGLSRLFRCFDPLDRATEDLPAELRDEVCFYSDWRGGEFDEPEGLIPKSGEWDYGVSGEPYGWIDKEEFRRRFAAGLRRFGKPGAEDVAST